MPFSLEDFFQRPAGYVSKNRWRTVRKLLRRDGPTCFFCGLKLGRDITIEHLLPKSEGGPDCLHNLALAHVACNQLADNMSIVDKVYLRQVLRERLKNG